MIVLQIDDAATRSVCARLAGVRLGRARIARVATSTWVIRGGVAAVAAGTGGRTSAGVRATARTVAGRRASRSARPARRALTEEVRQVLRKPHDATDQQEQRYLLGPAVIQIGSADQDHGERYQQRE